MGYILAIDASLTGSSVGLFCTDADKIISEIYSDHDMKQAEELAPLTKQVWKNREPLQHIAVTIGPGSFTGIRIALSFVQSLGFSIGVPVIGVSVFDAARIDHGAHNILYIDTKRDDLYVEVEQNKIEIWPYKQIELISNTFEIRRLSISSIVKASLLYPQNDSSPIYIRDAEVSLSRTIPPLIV
jgi:tRNA threonylcarbamoyl adenosine modification protein YeaZ